MNTTIVGQIAHLTCRGAVIGVIDVLVTGIEADGAVTGHRIVKKTGQPEKKIGTWPVENIISVVVK